jgi:hypothetical protein
MHGTPHQGFGMLGLMGDHMVGGLVAVVGGFGMAMVATTDNAVYGFSGMHRLRRLRFSRRANVVWQRCATQAVIVPAI